MPRKTLADLRPDPNADLIGYTFDSDHGPLTVTGSMPGLPTYVRCSSDTFKTARSAALLRQSIRREKERQL